MAFNPDLSRYLTRTSWYTRCSRMNINSTLMASATSLGSSGNPVTSSYETCPDSPASFCTRHSSSTIGTASVLSMAPVTSSSVRRNPRKTDVANRSDDALKLLNSRRTNDSCSHQNVSSSSLELWIMVPRFAPPGWSDSSFDEDLHAETIDPARSATDRFPSTTSRDLIQLQGSWRTSGLVDPWIAIP